MIDTLLQASLFYVIACRIRIALTAAGTTSSLSRCCKKLVSLGLEQAPKPNGLDQQLPALQDEVLTNLKNLARTDEARILYEKTVLWLVECQRLITGDLDEQSTAAPRRQKETSELWVHALDYFVRREVTKKLAQEQEMDEQEGQVYNLPFKMKVQDILAENKAMDERTKADVELKKKEEEAEIEANFPSYFDEFQKHLLSATDQRDSSKFDFGERIAKVEVRHREVSLESVMAELVGQSSKEDSTYRSGFLRLRLEVVQLALEQSAQLPGTQLPTSFVMSLAERDATWMEDAVNCLEDQLDNAKLKSVMNISELQLPRNFNFYHDTLPTEARLIFAPLSSIHQRMRTVMVDYESPLLNEVLFLSNYMMVTFNTKTTPLMKMLTGMELLLEKMDEWEAYASKKLNSFQDEILQLKQLIIRYRKI
jgi:hypothetical protein